ALVRWRGGLGVYPLDETAAFVPAHAEGLEARSRDLGDGRVDRYWEGSREAVERAAAEAPGGPGRRVFAERLPGGRFRTRVVPAPASADLEVGPGGIESIGAGAHGRALVIGLGASARTALATDDRLRSAPGRELAFACGTTLVSTMPLGQALA